MESNTTVLNSCFNLMRRLSPNDIKKNVAGLAALIQNDDLRYEVIQKIDQPLGKFNIRSYDRIHIILINLR